VIPYPALQRAETMLEGDVDAHRFPIGFGVPMGATAQAAGDRSGDHAIVP
jgi:hypothetical protein